MELIRKLCVLQEMTERFLVTLAGALLVVMMILVALEVVLRKLAGVSIPGLFEIASQLMVGITLLGIAFVQKLKEHINIDILKKYFSEPVIKATNLLGLAIGLILTAVFAWQCWNTAFIAWVIGEHTIGILPVPLWPGKLFASVSLSIASFRFLTDLLRELNDVQQTEKFQKERDIHI